MESVRTLFGSDEPLILRRPPPSLYSSRVLSPPIGAWTGIGSGLSGIIKAADVETALRNGRAFMIWTFREFAPACGVDVPAHAVFAIVVRLTKEGVTFRPLLINKDDAEPPRSDVMWMPDASAGTMIDDPIAFGRGAILDAGLVGLIEQDWNEVEVGSWRRFERLRDALGGEAEGRA